jgi:hypothetical protein
MTRTPRSLLAAALLAFAGLTVGPAPALAADVTVYSDEAAYDAAAGPSDFCLTFNGSPGAFVSGASFSADVIFGSPEASDPTLVNWSSDALSDAGSTTAPNGVGPLSGVFTGTAMAFKLNFLSAANAPSVDLYDAAGVLIAPVVAPSGSGFFGVVSDTAVKRFIIRPGTFEDGTRDRFFIDDFCATAIVEAPEDPDALCADLIAAVEAADGSAFRNVKKQGALLNKLKVVCRHVAKGTAKGNARALRKLSRDVLPKTDGEGSPRDWVTDPTVQQDLEDRIGALVAVLS